jgi:hypothetical protein
VATKLDRVEVGYVSDPEYADQLVLAAVEAALAGIGLDPGNQIEHRAVNGGAGSNEFANVAPVHADKVHRAINRNAARTRERVGEKIRECGFGHLARGHREFTMLDLAAAADVP